MIDFLKIHSLPVLPQILLKNDRLTFPQSNVSTEGEDLKRWQIAHFNSLDIGIKCDDKGNYSKLSGSIHKYRFGGENWQDFNLSNIQAVIHELSETFEFNPQKAAINFIEIGVNIPLDYSPDQIINCLVIHGKERFKELEINRNTKGNGRKSEKDQFVIKIYNKSLQYSLPFHLLRFEIKVRRMKFLERYGINGLTLADLTKPDLYPKFKIMLLDILSGILIYNPDIDPNKLTNLNDRELLKLGRYPDYWQQYKRSDKNQKSKDLIRFKELAGTNEIINNLKCKISDKWEILYNQDKITTFREDQNRPTNDPKGQINTTIKGYFVQHCIVTGLEIHNQRPGTKYISPKGIKWYFENEPETYKIKLESLLTEKWLFRHEGEPIENYFAEIYHQIRNRALNPQNNLKRSLANLENKGLKLFPTVELLRPEKFDLIKGSKMDVYHSK